MTLCTFCGCRKADHTTDGLAICVECEEALEMSEGREG